MSYSVDDDTLFKKGAFEGGGREVGGKGLFLATYIHGFSLLLGANTMGLY